MVLFSHKRTENSSLDTMKTENMFSLQISSCLQKNPAYSQVLHILSNIKNIFNTPFLTCILKVNTLKQFMHLFLSCVC